MPERNADPDARAEVIRRNGWALAYVSTALGLYFIGAHIESGKGRFQAAVWEAPLNVPGSPATWGVVILIGGLMQLAGRAMSHRRHHLDPHGRRWVHWGCVISFFWCVLIDGAQAVSLWGDDTGLVNATGLILWTYLAYIYQERVSLSARRFYA